MNSIFVGKAKTMIETSSLRLGPETSRAFMNSISVVTSGGGGGGEVGSYLSTAKKAWYSSLVPLSVVLSHA